MEFSDVVRRRRMVRNYLDEPVARSTIERIMAVARKAPSAGFSQGQSFVVVTEPERRRRIAELAGESMYVDKGFDPWISRAPVHIVVCVSERIYRDRYEQPDKRSPGEPAQEWPVPYWWVDGGASMMLLLLAAVDEGLAAGFLGVHAIGGLKDYLKIPDDVEPIGIVTLGRPAPDRPSGSLARGWKAAAEVIHWETYETPDGLDT